MTIKDLTTLEGFRALGAACEDKIAAAEKSLGLRFAGEYREFLKAFGAALVKNIELNGIAASERLDVTAVTLSVRKECPTIPPDTYVVENTGLEGIYILQDKSGVIYELGQNTALRKIADSLLEYILNE